jgi:hypothetical protein
MADRVCQDWRLAFLVFPRRYGLGITPEATAS